MELHPVSTPEIVFYVDIRMSSLIPYPLFKSWIKDSEHLLLIVVRTGFEPAVIGVLVLGYHSSDYS